MTVAAGTPFTVNSDVAAGTSLGVSLLDSTNVIALYNASTQYKARIIGDNEGLGTEFTLDTLGFYGVDLAILALSATKAITIREGSGDGDGAKARILSVSGTTITAPGSDNNFSGSGLDGYSVVALSSTSAIGVVSTLLGRAHYFTVSGNTITDESSVTFEAGNIWSRTALCKLTSTKAVVVYVDDNDGDQLKAVVLSVTGTTISAGSPSIIDAGDIADYPALAEISTTSCLLTYGNTTDGAAKAVVLSGMSGTTVTVNTPIVIDSLAVQANSLAAFSATQFVAAYSRPSDDSGRFIELAVSGTVVSTVGSDSEYDAGAGVAGSSVAYSASQVVQIYTSSTEAVMFTLSSSVSHLWLSIDGGANYTDIGDSAWAANVVGGVVVVPGTAYQTIFAAVGTNLYKTINGGTAWSLETAIGYEVDFLDLEKDNATVLLKKRDTAGAIRSQLWDGLSLSNISTGNFATGGSTSGGDVV